MRLQSDTKATVLNGIRSNDVETSAIMVRYSSGHNCCDVECGGSTTIIFTPKKVDISDGILNSDIRNKIIGIVKDVSTQFIHDLEIVLSHKLEDYDEMEDDK